MSPAEFHRKNRDPVACKCELLPVVVVGQVFCRRNGSLTAGSQHATPERDRALADTLSALADPEAEQTRRVPQPAYEDWTGRSTSPTCSPAPLSVVPTVRRKRKSEGQRGGDDGTRTHDPLLAKRGHRVRRKPRQRIGAGQQPSRAEMYLPGRPATNCTHVCTQPLLLSL